MGFFFFKKNILVLLNQKEKLKKFTILLEFLKKSVQGGLTPLAYPQHADKL